MARYDIRGPSALQMGHRRLKACRVDLRLDWAADCRRLDPRDAGQSALAFVTFATARNQSPVCRGQAWRLGSILGTGVLALDLVALDWVGAAEHVDRHWIWHEWSFLVVAVPADPLCWFPQAAWASREENPDVLADLAKSLREEFADAAAVTFNAEGGFKI